MRKAITIFLFLISSSSFGQKTVIYKFEDGKKLSEKVYKELTSNNNFQNNMVITIKDSILSKDSITYLIDVRKKIEVNYNFDNIKYIEARYLPESELAFAESQHLIDSLGLKLKDNYYTNPKNLKLKLLEYKYSKNKQDQEILEIQNNISIYKNREAIIVSILNENLFILVKRVSDSLFQNINELPENPKRIISKNPFNNKDIILNNDNFSYVKTDNGDVSFFSNNLKEDFFEIFKKIRNIKWENSFIVSLKKGNHKSLDKVRILLIEKHLKFKLPINKRSYEEPLLMEEIKN